MLADSRASSRPGLGDAGELDLLWEMFVFLARSINFGPSWALLLWLPATSREFGVILPSLLKSACLTQSFNGHKLSYLQPDTN